ERDIDAGSSCPTALTRLASLERRRQIVNAPFRAEFRPHPALKRKFAPAMHDPGQDDNPHKCQHEQRRVVRRPAYFNGDALVQKVDWITDRAEQLYAFPFWT